MISSTALHQRTFGTDVLRCPCGGRRTIRRLHSTRNRAAAVVALDVKATSRFSPTASSTHRCARCTSSARSPHQKRPRRPSPCHRPPPLHRARSPGRALGFPGCFSCSWRGGSHVDACVSAHHSTGPGCRCVHGCSRFLGGAQRHDGPKIKATAPPGPAART